MGIRYFFKRFVSDYWWFYHHCGGNTLRSTRYAYANCASNIDCYLSKLQIKHLYKKINDWLIAANEKRG